jgi:hypothetical protein
MVAVCGFGALRSTCRPSRRLPRTARRRSRMIDGEDKPCRRQTTAVGSALERGPSAADGPCRGIRRPRTNTAITNTVPAAGRPPRGSECPAAMDTHAWRGRAGRPAAQRRRAGRSRHECGRDRGRPGSRRTSVMSFCASRVGPAKPISAALPTMLDVLPLDGPQLARRAIDQSDTVEPSVQRQHVVDGRGQHRQLRQGRTRSHRTMR